MKNFFAMLLCVVLLCGLCCAALAESTYQTAAMLDRNGNITIADENAPALTLTVDREAMTCSYGSDQPLSGSIAITSEGIFQTPVEKDQLQTVECTFTDGSTLTLHYIVERDIYLYTDKETGMNYALINTTATKDGVCVLTAALRVREGNSSIRQENFGAFDLSTLTAEQYVTPYISLGNPTSEEKTVQITLLLDGDPLQAESTIDARGTYFLLLPEKAARKYQTEGSHSLTVSINGTEVGAYEWSLRGQPGSL